jgi:hypothetical protein
VTRHLNRWCPICDSVYTVESVKRELADRYLNQGVPIEEIVDDCGMTRQWVTLAIRQLLTELGVDVPRDLRLLRRYPYRERARRALRTSHAD